MDNDLDPLAAGQGRVSLHHPVHQSVLTGTGRQLSSAIGKQQQRQTVLDAGEAGRLRLEDALRLERETVEVVWIEYPYEGLSDVTFVLHEPTVEDEISGSDSGLRCQIRADVGYQTEPGHRLDQVLHRFLRHHRRPARCLLHEQRQSRLILQVLLLEIRRIHLFLLPRPGGCERGRRSIVSFAEEPFHFIDDQQIQVVGVADGD